MAVYSKAIVIDTPSEPDTRSEPLVFTGLAPVAVGEDDFLTFAVLSRAASLLEEKLKVTDKAATPGGAAQIPRALPGAAETPPLFSI